MQTFLSRRSFFALCSGAAAASVAAPLVPTSAAPAYDWHEFSATWTTGAPLTAEHLNSTYEYTLKHDLAAVCFSDDEHAVGLLASQVDDRLLSAEFRRVEYRANLLTRDQINLLRSRVRLTAHQARQALIASPRG